MASDNGLLEDCEVLSHYGTCHLGLSQLLKTSECTRYDTHLLVLYTYQFVEKRHDFQRKRHDSEYSRIKNNNFPWRRSDSKNQNIIYLMFVTLVSPCMEGSLAKAACNNDDSCDCNKLDFIIELN